MTAEKNRTALRESVETLNQIATSPATPRTIKRSIAELVASLESGEYSMAVRAANAMSSLEDITQDPNMPSFVRTTIWQAVAKLEGIKD